MQKTKKMQLYAFSIKKIWKNKTILASIMKQNYASQPFQTTLFSFQDIATDLRINMRKIILRY